MTATHLLVHALCIGTRTRIHDTGSGAWWDRAWETGLYKLPVTTALWLGGEGLVGDAVADKRVHGGPDKAVCCYAYEHYQTWNDELQCSSPKVDAFNGHMQAGAFGENFSTIGALEGDVCVGDVLTVGEACVEVSQPRQPCAKLQRRWRLPQLSARVQATGKTGFYLRVLQPGRVSVGDVMMLRERRHAALSITVCNRVMDGTASDEEMRALMACAHLSASWQQQLARRGR